MPRERPKNAAETEFRSGEEAVRNGKKGGIKSGEARREISTFKDIANKIINSEIKKEKVIKFLEEMGVPVTERTNKAAIIAGQLKEAIQGNTGAAKYLIELSGETENAAEQEAKPFELPARVIGSAYADINRWIDDYKYTYYDFKGGRGSLKSSFCALKLIDIIMRNENYCAMAVRQVKDTLKDSVYAQITWAIDELDLTEEFHATKNPMEIKRKKTGQIIYFRGADDPMKIKSIRPPKDMYIGVLWIEEADQLHGTEALRNIYQSVMRGGDGCIIFRSYNTPISQMHYINKEALQANDKRIIHHSYYYDAPREWLGKDFFDLAEHTKETNERIYRHEYLGEATGTGGNVFENIAERIITDEEYQRFDRFKFGIDFGFAIDEFAWIKVHYDRKKRILYILDEIYEQKLSNKRAVEMIRQKHKGSMAIVADSAEPKSIAEMQSLGLNITGAKKGADSVDYGFKFLQDMNEIVIDKHRTPNAYKEFVSYEYERNKNGEYISVYPDKNDHILSAVRYALESEMKQSRIYTSNSKII